MDNWKHQNDFGQVDGGARSLHDKAHENGPPQSKTIIACCWIALAATIACNALFESMKLGGVTSAEVSNEVFAWFAPAGYVFAIWGVIYAALVVWMISATVRARTRQVITAREGLLFCASCALNIGWLVAFHYRLIGLSLALITLLWIALLFLYSSFWKRGEPLWTRVPFSLYFGWLTVAVCANAAHLVARWPEIPLIASELSTVIIVVGLIITAFAMARLQNDLVFPLVVLWAAVGVGARLLPVDHVVALTLFALSAAGALAIYLPALFEKMRPRRAGAEPFASE